MTVMQFRAEMLRYACKTAAILCEGTVIDGKKIEPEQVRKNAATIQALLTETVDFLEEYLQNVCSDSENSITEQKENFKD